MHSWSAQASQPHVSTSHPLHQLVPPKELPGRCIGPEIVLSNRVAEPHADIVDDFGSGISGLFEDADVKATDVIA